MNKNGIIKVLFEQYYDCEKITRTNAGIITDEQRAISENNFNMLIERFFSMLEKQSDASESGLNIPCVSVSLPDDVDVSIKIENQINFIKNNWNVSENYLDGYAKGFYYCVKFMRGNKR